MWNPLKKVQVRDDKPYSGQGKRLADRLKDLDAGIERLNECQEQVTSDMETLVESISRKVS